MKNIISVIFLLAMVQVAYAQPCNCDVYFKYDAAGNRTKHYQSCNGPQMMALIPDQIAPAQEELSAANETTQPTTAQSENNTTEDLNSVSVFKVYPNPTEGFLKLEGGGFTSDAIVVLYDIKGQLVFSQNFGFGELDITQLQSGTYSVQVRENGKSLSAIFVKL